jgi:hypothetical protein
MTIHRRVVLLPAAGILALAVGCSSDSAAPTPDAQSGGVADAGVAGAADAAADAAAPAMLEGIAGESCAAGCEALGKTCVVACQEHRSCGSHDGVAPPYAGYACYFWENEDGTFRSNDGRSFTSCDEPVSLTWDNFGTIEELGDYLGGNPVSCCCR